jgi:hypothetical protein
MCLNEPDHPGAGRDPFLRRSEFRKQWCRLGSDADRRMWRLWTPGRADATTTSWFNVFHLRSGSKNAP